MEITWNYNFFESIAVIGMFLFFGWHVIRYFLIFLAWLAFRNK